MALLTWALASPSGSAPDDDFHIANIYCLHDSSTCRSDDWAWPGEVVYWYPNPSDRGPEYRAARRAYPDLWRFEQPRALPCYVTNGGTWYGPDAAEPADCLNEEDPTANRPASLDDLGYYPSLYYRFASLFTGDTIRESVVHWRVLNVIAAMAMLAASLLLSAPRYRRPIAVAALTAAVPLGLFLVSSTNPSAWLLSGTAAFLGPAVTLLRERGSPRVLVVRTVFVLMCLVMMLGGRSEGAGHAAVLVLLALLLGLKAPRYVYATVVALGLLTVLVAVIVFSRSDTSKLGSIWDTFTAGLGIGAGTSSLWDALTANPDFFFGQAASRLGWIEITLPSSATVAIAAAFWGTAILGIAVMFWRKGVAIALVGGVLLVVPAALNVGGTAFQPTRYFLPLVYMLAFVFLVPDWGKWLPRWSSAQWIALGAALSIANSLSLLYLTVRYVSGIQPGTTNPRSLSAAGTPDWWWGAWLSPFWNWALGSVAFAVAVGLLFTLPSIREGAEDHADDELPALPDDLYHDFWNPPEYPEVQVPAAR